MVLASVVIPAHDEAQVIERCLRRLTSEARPGELEVIVVCNGCTDDTAGIARSAAPDATVIEIPTASKVAALNAGDAEARAFPRFYVDADVELGIEALRETAAALAEGAECAAPAPQFAIEDRSWAIRTFYGVWQRLPFLADDGVVGNGVYALSAAGRARFGPFPSLTADDQYVMQLFPKEQRSTVRTSSFTIHPPTDLRDLIRVRTRVYRGNEELSRSGLARSPAPGGAAKALCRLARDPRTIPAVALYATVNGVARQRARRPARGWERDESARRAAPRQARP